MLETLVVNSEHGTAKQNKPPALFAILVFSLSFLNGRPGGTFA